MVTANSGEGAGSYSGPRSSTALTALEKPWAEMLCQECGPRGIQELLYVSHYLTPMLAEGENAEWSEVELPWGPSCWKSGVVMGVEVYN